MLQLPAGREASRVEHVPRYERHRPEQTLLYQLVEEYYPAFEAQWAAEGRVLPYYVHQEFDEYLKCGRLEHGFLRVQCDKCHAECKLYTTKTPITAADLLNDRVLPFYEAHNLPVLRILTDRGTEYCGRAETHDYQLFLAINDIDHTKTKAQSPQTNGICERFHKAILHEFYQVTFRKKLYGNLDELQKDLDDWLEYYNNERTHQGKMCCGRTPMQTLEDGKQIWQEKFVA